MIKCQLLDDSSNIWNVSKWIDGSNKDVNKICFHFCLSINIVYQLMHRIDRFCTKDWYKYYLIWLIWLIPKYLATRSKSKQKKKKKLITVDSLFANKCLLLSIYHFSFLFLCYANIEYDPFGAKKKTICQSISSKLNGFHVKQATMNSKNNLPWIKRLDADKDWQDSSLDVSDNPSESPNAGSMDDDVVPVPHHNVLQVVGRRALYNYFFFCLLIFDGWWCKMTTWARLNVVHPNQPNHIYIDIVLLLHLYIVMKCVWI